MPNCDLDAVREQHRQADDYIREEGRIEERARIVAWMRASRTPHAQADAIERKDHWSEVRDVIPADGR